jgi:hypothetical protein
MGDIEITGAATQILCKEFFCRLVGWWIHRRGETFDLRNCLEKQIRTVVGMLIVYQLYMFVALN